MEIRDSHDFSSRCAKPEKKSRGGVLLLAQDFRCAMIFAVLRFLDFGDFDDFYQNSSRRF
jgi:hypothetical protein